jgi:soluble lytic murein transglycosylase
MENTKKNINLFETLTIKNLSFKSAGQIHIEGVSKITLMSFIFAALNLSITAQLASAATSSNSKTHMGSISTKQAQARLEHSQELLGKYYKKSSVRFGEKVPKINSQIYRWTKEYLADDYKKDYRKIAQTIIDQSLKYEFDPVFILSIIQTESRFNPLALGTSGEIGLMQILPNTAKWMAGKIDMKWNGDESLKDPLVNIRIGAAFMAYLRDHFDMHAQLYIAAYNMGQGNVKSARARKIWPKDYPIAVMKNYVEFYEDLKEKRSPANKQASL